MKKLTSGKKKSANIKKFLASAFVAIFFLGG
jgi:hypothetical protein